MAKSYFCEDCHRKVAQYHFTSVQIEIASELLLYRINPNVKTITYTTMFDNTNAVNIMSQYDLVLDCTDNPSTRYLISDSSRALGIPLISGAAMRYDGQLCTYNCGPTGPCYRCIFPMPPKPETVGTCEEAGVLGVVTGVIGTLQAMEAIKILTSNAAGALCCHNI